jgi:hypothetical protein
MPQLRKINFALMALAIALCTACGSEDEGPAEIPPVVSNEAREFFMTHWDPQYLVEGFNPAGTDIERAGEGAIYFPYVTPIFSIDELEKLPLWVSIEDDDLEHMSNAAKWDQFIFGWDDYKRASISYPEIGYEPTLTRSDLQEPWVSPNREKFRELAPRLTP